jgi:hypothetical protein
MTPHLTDHAMHREFICDESFRQHAFRRREPRLRGWRGELLAQISAAPSRRVAENLLALSQSAIDGLPDDARERLVAHVQDVLAELPERD